MQSDVPAPGRRRRRALAVLAVLGAGALGACSLDGLLKSDELPPQVTDPAITETPAGARAAYHSALYGLQLVFGSDGSASFVALTGLLSDELSGGVDGGDFFNPVVTNPVSLRRLEDAPTTNVGEITSAFQALHNVRQRARQAGGLASDYLPAAEAPALRAHLYAIEGYAEVLLAELFCSGIPLSTVDYKGDYTLQPGSSTAQVFTHAVALFDSALALASATDSAGHLSRLGRGRALLGLGDYAAAAAAVAAVPDTFRYAFRYTGTGGPQGIGWYGNGSLWFRNGVQDGEGTNGLDYIASGDLRTRTTLRTTEGGSFYHPDKYHTTGVDTVVLASGVEARLIAAEAALQQGGPGWLDTLNVLRTAGMETVPPDTVRDTLGITGCSLAQKCGTDGVSGGTFQVPAGYDLPDSVQILPMSSTLRNNCRAWSTYPPCFLSPNSTSYTWVRLYVRPPFDRWSRGAGGYTDLPPLADPVDPQARVDLLFRERAFWLFLTGHRQGDMRRLVRQYQRAQATVYPVGTSPLGGESYGSYIDLPIPWRERELNPLFTGCGPR